MSVVDFCLRGVRFKKNLMRVKLARRGKLIETGFKPLPHLVATSFFQRGQHRHPSFAGVCALDRLRAETDFCAITNCRRSRSAKLLSAGIDRSFAH